MGLGLRVQSFDGLGYLGRAAWRVAEATARTAAQSQAAAQQRENGLSDASWVQTYAACPKQQATRCDHVPKACYITDLRRPTILQRLNK